MKVMHKVAVVGDRDSVLGFRALGVHDYIAINARATRTIVDDIAKKGYGVIFITEQLANLIPETIERYNSEMIPAVILIPSNQGSLNIGLNNINRNVEKAVGSNIL